MASVEIPAAWLSVLETLQRQQVEYVIAGSAADAIVEDDAGSAARLVIAPAPYRRNLERLARALGSRTLAVRGAAEPLDPRRLVNHPALRWQLLVGGTELDVIGSAVGDGEFSIRVWRTRPVELYGGERRITAEVERASEFPVVA